MFPRPMCTDRDIKEALALHKPCRQIYVPSFQQEKKYSPGILIYNWAEERHKVGLSEIVNNSSQQLARSYIAHNNCHQILRTFRHVSCFR